MVESQVDSDLPLLPDVASSLPVDGSELPDTKHLIPLPEVHQVEQPLSSPPVAQGELLDNTPESQAKHREPPVAESEPQESTPLSCPPMVDNEPLEDMVIAVNPLEVAADMAFKDIGEAESADAGNTLEVNPAPAAPSNEPVEETVVEKASVTPAKIEKPVRDHKKSGRKLPGETKKLVEQNLSPGKKVKAKELAKLIEMTESGVNLCKKTKKLHEWGLELVPDSFPQLFRRI